MVSGEADVLGGILGDDDVEVDVVGERWKFVCL
jgi:hypothetical protein